MKVVEEDMTRNCLRKDSEYAFINRVINNWNSLSAYCVHCKSINTSKKHLACTEIGSCIVLELVATIVGNIWRKPALTYASTVCGIAGVGEFGYLLQSRDGASYKSRDQTLLEA